MDELATVSPAAPAEDVESLARELSRAYLQMATFYRQRMGLSPDEADAAARSTDDHRWARRALDTPADQVSWFDLSTLAEHDPEAALAAWRRIEAEARVELASGHRAARALAWDDTPWQRARFLAIRESFRAEWRPRGGIEDALIDQMAQAQSSYLFWMERLHIQSVTEARAVDRKLDDEGYWQPPRVDAAAALNQSAAMPDRFHRLFLRALRALRDLRRYTPSVVVQNAGQINVGRQQLNLAGVDGRPDRAVE